MIDLVLCKVLKYHGSWTTFMCCLACIITVWICRRCHRAPADSDHEPLSSLLPFFKADFLLSASACSENFNSFLDSTHLGSRSLLCQPLKQDSSLPEAAKHYPAEYLLAVASLISIYLTIKQ